MRAEEDIAKRLFAATRTLAGVLWEFLREFIRGGEIHSCEVGREGDRDKRSFRDGAEDTRVWNLCARWIGFSNDIKYSELDWGSPMRHR